MVEQLRVLDLQLSGVGDQQAGRLGAVLEPLALEVVKHKVLVQDYVVIIAWSAFGSRGQCTNVLF